MTRITPRTCLWPLAGSLVVTFCLSIGLTFRSDHHCYAGTCGEWLFPLQARLHVVVWYCWLAISVTILAIRAFHPSLRKVLSRRLFERKIPFLQKHLAIGGFLIIIWVLCLYGIVFGIWWIRLRDYFTQRGTEGGVVSGNGRLAAIALTGHLCDITMGMAIIPISRHSALASFFKLGVSTTLTFHVITAYTLFALVLIHGFLYVSWVPVYNGFSETLRRVFPVLNPTYLYYETWPGNQSSLGVWRASLIFTGIVTTFCFLLIFLTTLPSVRKNHFNVFYFTHLLGPIAIVIICLHASTMFYCTSPGLFMWLLDWLMRLYELWAPLAGKIEALGKGWYLLSVPLPRRRLDGCACTSPLAHFFIYHSESSVRELHPFTTTTHLASQNTITHHAEDDINIQFLFRKRGAAPTIVVPLENQVGFAHSFFSILGKLRHAKPRPQWTDRLAGFANEDSKGTSSIPTVSNTGKLEPNLEPQLSPNGEPVTLRLEGPYFTTADPSSYNTVVCIVAGTGVSGAMAISGAFKELDRQFSSSARAGEPYRRPKCTIGGPSEPTPVSGHTENGRSASVVSVGRERLWTRCIVVWSVREDNYIELPELTGTPTPGFELRVNLTGKGKKRLSIEETLDDILDEDTMEKTSSPSRTWVYISGPNAFIEAGETACKARHTRGVEYYGARWDV